MTLQEKKEQLAQEWFDEKPNKGEVREKQSFISGFDEADPIGYLDWHHNTKEWYPVSDGIFRNTDESGETITKEQLYLKFIEYKQAIKHHPINPTLNREVTSGFKTVAYGGTAVGGIERFL